ncbi:MAG: exopolyphosphatase [Pseudanabaenaceae cyanobacterium SKYGB_i_bin29]|nr:exopolyphosphatase [Pseudanabaenaceae cyanobacterium SKYG29]MDW8421837.1 exopolyphosphatase [Pseudanabaenaceae cyanobacterium SKYGB_i_bin29]
MAKYRLITRSDLDGIVCAVILKELDLIDEIVFAHPKDMQDGKITVTERDITANLPYVPGVYLAFDHHYSETLRLASAPPNLIIDPEAPSAARVVYNYYGGKLKLPQLSQEMMAAVDKSDAAQFTLEEILQPTGWTLLSFLLDARTGLGRFKDFRISNYQLMLDLTEYLRTMSIAEVMAQPDVKERVDLYREYEDKFKAQLQRVCQVIHPLVVVDLREEEIIYPGNRFMVYALNPDCNISMHIIWGVKQQNTVFAVGKSILNRTSPVNVGALMLRYGGGGHTNAGTCQVDNDRVEAVREELIQTILNLSQEVMLTP